MSRYSTCFEVSTSELAVTYSRSVTFTHVQSNPASRVKRQNEVSVFLESLSFKEHCNNIQQRNLPTGQFSFKAKNILTQMSVNLRLHSNPLKFKINLNYERKPISKIQIVIEKKRMEIMTYKQHLFFKAVSIQI